MNNYRRFMTVAVAAGLIILVITNVIYLVTNNDTSDRYYAVEVRHVMEEIGIKVHNYVAQERNDDSHGNVIADNIIQNDIIPEIDLSKYRYVTHVSVYSPDDICNSEYAVEEADGVLYRIEYDCDNDYSALIYMNASVGVMYVFIIILLIYIKMKIIRPFADINDITYELAKGNLTTPLKEERSRYMGSFLWGLDMLRENLEESKEKEIELQREKKELILSISHDIKTPLAAIELYSRALSDGIYDDNSDGENAGTYNMNSRQLEALEGISKNTKEIKKYVDEIINASKEDIINMDVKISEFYQSELIESVRKYYAEKLELLHTEFNIDNYEDCILKGDRERTEEVVQNVMENAIKYGDGKRIDISFTEEEDCRIIIISNTGNTLEKDEINNIFDSFYRGSNSHNIKGSGLGLYICRKLMRCMDGDIYADIRDDIFSIGVVIRKV